jgi:hypothetical protein
MDVFFTEQYFPKYFTKLVEKIKLNLSTLYDPFPRFAEYIVALFNEIVASKFVILSTLLNKTAWTASEVELFFNTVKLKYDVDVFELNGVYVWEILHKFSHVFVFQSGENEINPNEVEYLESEFILKKTVQRYIMPQRDCGVLTIRNEYTKDNITIRSYDIEFAGLIASNREISNPLHDGVTVSFKTTSFPYGTGPFDLHQIFFTYKAPRLVEDYIKDFDKKILLNNKTSMLQAVSFEKNTNTFFLLPLSLYHFNLTKRLKNEILPLEDTVKENLIKAFSYIKIWYLMYVINGSFVQGKFNQLFDNQDLHQTIDDLLFEYSTNEFTERFFNSTIQQKTQIIDIVKRAK